MKDNFSKQSQLYARFRPTYPSELYDFLLSAVSERTAAWDCGTGNGQVAVELSKYFDNVFATDISEDQIKNAVARDNIFYTIQRAEHTSFENNTFDLITVAQAIHWFEFSKFYHEVDRTLKPKGVIALFGYSLMNMDQRTDKVIHHFYEDIIGSYWDNERRYVDEHYQTIPFPFKEITSSTITAHYDWTLEQLLGYLRTWSAVQHYVDQHNDDPISKIINDLQNCWGESKTKPVTFPIFMRIGVKTTADAVKLSATSAITGIDNVH
ncbi:MAG: class I SAM-dependent methyltransferase [Ignavibacteria bacterium]|nr:class I SAM-dependent methyltransferase [Ignavibacteria bacterium]MBI3766718.1 class I SAM-dependent methyltransferase [Ignavibacteriales bacterium]